jgi:hypothetical protein
MFTHLLKERSVEIEVVSEKGVGAGEAHVALERAMPVQSSNDGGWRWVWASLWSLCADAEEVILKISVKEVSRVGCATCCATGHVEAYMSLSRRTLVN